MWVNKSSKMHKTDTKVNGEKDMKKICQKKKKDVKKDEKYNNENKFVKE